MLGIPFLDDAITKWFKPQTFDDPVDRLNYFVTSTLLTFFAIMVSAKQYVGSPIQCWMPMEFKGGWEQYAEDYCFIQNTFYFPFDQSIPEELGLREEAEIGYYQWVPIVLALQALMFYVPFWIWKTLHQQSGIDLNTAISDARKMRSIRSTERREEISKLALYIEECLEFAVAPRSRRFLCFRFGRGLGSYVSTLYLMVKLLYMVNIFTQFVLLNNFLGSQYTLWGFQTFNDLWHGREWMESGVFPRVTLCDFKVRRLANIHRYTVQCVLMINLFNEKLYLFIWFWFLFVGVSTIINFLYCLFTLLSAGIRERTTRGLLSQNRFSDMADIVHDHTLVRRFVHNALRPDGVLMLRFIEGHAGAIVARDLTAQLYMDFCSNAVHYNNRSSAGMGPPSHSTKSTSPGIVDGFNEELYDTKNLNSALLQPDSGGYIPPPKPKHV